MSDKVRPCWWNCYASDDKSFLDDELLAIDAMEYPLAPLDKTISEESSGYKEDDSIFLSAVNQST